jgi:hypothetical protein
VVAAVGQVFATSCVALEIAAPSKSIALVPACVMVIVTACAVLPLAGVDAAAIVPVTTIPFVSTAAKEPDNVPAPVQAVPGVTTGEAIVPESVKLPVNVDVPPTPVTVTPDGRVPATDARSMNPFMVTVEPCAPEVGVITKKLPLAVMVSRTVTVFVPSLIVNEYVPIRFGAVAALERTAVEIEPAASVVIWLAVKVVHAVGMPGEPVTVSCVLALKPDTAR